MRVRCSLVITCIALMACSSQSSGALSDAHCPANPAQLRSGVTCAEPGQVCCSIGGTADPSCSADSGNQCRCESGAWNCAIISGQSGPTTCPDPSSVISGTSCAGFGSAHCPSSERGCAPSEAGSASCTCDGHQWACPASDAGGCVFPSAPEASTGSDD